MKSRQAQGFKKVECVRNAPFGKEVETNNGWLFSAFENGVLRMRNINKNMEIRFALEDYNAKEIKRLVMKEKEEQEMQIN